MAFDALLTESVQTIETFGVAVTFKADLTDEELIMDLLGQLASSCRGCRHLELTGGAR